MLQHSFAMQKSVLAFGTIAFVTVGGAASASAHDAPQVRYELRERGYYQIQFLVNQAPFQVNACRYGDRYHLNVDWYGRVPGPRMAAQLAAPIPGLSL